MLIYLAYLFKACVLFRLVLAGGLLVLAFIESFVVWLFFFQFWYFTYGTKDVLERECKDLHTKLKVRSAIHSIKLCSYMD